MALCGGLGCRQPKPVTVDSAPAGAETGTAPISGTETLAHPEGWAELPQADDPYPLHRPDSVDCDPEAWHEEDGLFEVETNLCNYINLVQPSQSDVIPGDAIELLVFHSALSSVDEPAEAHIAVLLDGGVLMDQIIPIPSTSEIYDQTILAETNVAKGAPIVLHLHNHGGNAWKLGHLRRVRD